MLLCQFLVWHLKCSVNNQCMFVILWRYSSHLFLQSHSISTYAVNRSQVFKFCVGIYKWPASFPLPIKWHNKDNCKCNPNPSEHCLYPVIIYIKPITIITNFVVFFRLFITTLYESLSIITHPKSQQIWIHSIQPQTNLLRKRWKIQDSSNQIQIFRKLTSNPPNSCVEEGSISSIWSRQPRNRSGAAFSPLAQTQVHIYMANF